MVKIGDNKMPKQTPGFTNNENNGKPKDIYHMHLGELVNITRGGNIAYGIYRGIDRDESGEITANLLPNISLNPNDTYYIEYDRPAQVSVPFDMIRPAGGTIEEWVHKFQNDLNESKNINNLKKEK